MARRAYNIQAIDPRPSLQKKKSQFRGGLWVSAVHVRVWGGGVRGVVEGVGGTGHGNR